MDRGLYIQKILAGENMLDTKTNTIVPIITGEIIMKSIYVNR